MQGTLNEIDIRSILQLIDLGQRTGELFVEADYPLIGGRNDFPNSQSQQASWLIFFANGKIVYAADQTNNSLQRLRDYLRRYRVEDVLDRLASETILNTSTREYGFLWLLLEKKVLTPAQGKEILESMVTEILFDLLSLNQGRFTFAINSTLAPQLSVWEIEPMVNRVIKEVQQWKQLHPFIQSLDQCPVLRDEALLGMALPENSYKSLQRWADGKTSLRQLSRYLNRPLFAVANVIYTYIQKDWVEMQGENEQRTPEIEQKETIPRVICLDDEPLVGNSIAQILAEVGCETIVITDAVKFLSESFRSKPDLILCDILMPELNGYEICKMLRHSDIFRQTPIIMLSGKDGFVDRVKARMVGSTDYLTKPFDKSELLVLIGKYLDISVDPKRNMLKTGKAQA